MDFRNSKESRRCSYFLTLLPSRTPRISCFIRCEPLRFSDLSNPLVQSTVTSGLANLWITGPTLVEETSGTPFLGSSLHGLGHQEVLQTATLYLRKLRNLPSSSPKVRGPMTIGTVS